MGRFARRRMTAEEREARRLARHEKLRQIKGHYVHREHIHGPFIHAGDAILGKLLGMVKAPGPLLVAANERHTNTLERVGYDVTWHTERPVDPEDVILGRVFRQPDLSGPLSKAKIDKPFPGAFICERVHKQNNLHDYLVALRNAVTLDAPVAIVVPNAHHELINDHVNLFTAGTLVYNLVRAGWNCRDARVTYDGRFINILMRRVDTPFPYPEYVDELQPFTPFRRVFNYCSSEFVQVYRM